LFQFLIDHREELIARCEAKVALRPGKAPSRSRSSDGLPIFLDQLIRTLKADDAGETGESAPVSGASGGHVAAQSEMRETARAHGRSLLDLGYTIEQVVYDYGDMCQAITDLAVERAEPFATDEFRTLNRCLDIAIADAVGEFANQRAASVAGQTSASENQRLGFLVHEFRNHLQVASLALIAIESGKVGVGGSTSGVLKRSLTAMSALLDGSIAAVRRSAHIPAQECFTVAAFIADAQLTAALYAGTSGCTLTVAAVDPLLAVVGNRALLAAALMNLLQNAFKFTHAQTDIALTAEGVGDHVLISVRDRCGGMPPGTAELLFRPFNQFNANKSGLGLGLSIARQSVEADGGTLDATNLPGIGCVFTISLPRQPLI
jgi:signal transduction histidine kinase